jgi:hypothetical protein
MKSIFEKNRTIFIKTSIKPIATIFCYVTLFALAANAYRIKDIAPRDIIDIARTNANIFGCVCSAAGTILTALSVLFLFGKHPHRIKDMSNMTGLR